MYMTIMDDARPLQEIQVRQDVGGFAGFLLNDGECKLLPSDAVATRQLN